MRKMSMLVMGVIASGLLVGCAATDQITLTVRNHETGEPIADVKVEHYRFSLWKPLVATKRTDKTGTVVFRGNPEKDWCEVYSNSRASLRFNWNGKEKLPRLDRNTVYRNRMNVFTVGYPRDLIKGRTESFYVSDGDPRPMDEQTAYVGTYTGDSGSKGIYRIRVDKKKGITSKPELVAEVANPSFLTFTSGGWGMYAVSESLNKVFTYDVGNEEGMLTLVKEQETGKGPCHVEIGSYQYLAVANYGDGSVNVWWRHRGKDDHVVFSNNYASKATNRQQGPHAHGVTFSPSGGRLLLVPDLGADRVYVYEIKWNANRPVRIEPHATAPWIELPPGRGPRHVAFSQWPRNNEPDNLYVLNELSNTICVFEYEKKEGLFTFVEEVSTLPAGFTGESLGAELIVWGRETLYATNRGHDSIARFQRDPETGRLTLVECVPCGGKWPRHFTIMPNRSWEGSLMLVANQNSNNIAVFRIGKEGALTLMPDAGVDIGAPACVVF